MLSKWNVNIMCCDSNSQRYGGDRHWWHRVVIGSDGIGSYNTHTSTNILKKTKKNTSGN